MNTKRIKLFCFAIIAMLCGIVILPARLVDAKESEKTGYWEYVKSWDEQSDSLTVEGYNYKEVIRGSALQDSEIKRLLQGMAIVCQVQIWKTDYMKVPVKENSEKLYLHSVHSRGR